MFYKGDKMQVKYKLPVFLVVTVLVLFVMATVVYAQTTAFISANNVNIRTGATTNSTVLRKLSIGAEIIVLSKESGGWFKIEDKTQKSGFAYVKDDYVEIVQVSGTVNANGVNIREGASTDTSVLGKLNKNDVITVTGTVKNFYIFSMEGISGFIHKDFVNISGDLAANIQEQDQVSVIQIDGASRSVSTGSYTYAKVISTSGINFRKGPSLDDQVLFGLASGELVDVISATGEWYKVKYAGIEGFVFGQFVELYTGEKPSLDARAQKANALVAFAKKYLGTPYRWGGTSLTKGVDCSGFTYEVFRNFGYNLNRVSRDQAKNGEKVDRANLLPGDLVFFDTDLDGTISHVGIYIGDGQFINSSSGSKYCVLISNINDSYNSKRYVTARRIIK